MNIVQKLRYLLLPFSLAYGSVMGIRNLLFQKGVFKSTRFAIPVIGLGNISLGGTGKTPHTEFLIKLLSPSYKVATLSRGYKRISKGFLEVTPESMVEMVGDEPLQMKLKFPHVRCAVDENRVHGIHTLLENNGEQDVILLDDAFQHRKVKPGLQILLIDFFSPIKKDFVIPAGNLREFPSGRRRADVIIVTKCPNLFSHEVETWKQNYLTDSKQEIFFSRYEYGEPQPIFAGGTQLSNAQMLDYEVLLITGIANAKPLHKRIKSRCAKVNHLEFPDHHAFSEKDVAQIEAEYKAMKSERKVIITTEKDSVRLQEFVTLQNKFRNNLFYIPIEVKILFGHGQHLKNLIFDYVRANS